MPKKVSSPEKREKMKIADNGAETARQKSVVALVAQVNFLLVKGKFWKISSEKIFF